MTTDKLIVAAIDFGTTFSSYALSFRNDFEQDPYKIHANNWIGGGHISQKAPTTVLFTPQKVFHSFGYEAEDKYAELAEEEEHKDWYYFRRFKMMLHENKSISRTTMLLDQHKKELPALVVFSSTIRYLKNHLIQTIQNRITGITERDVHFVLTVPAIWNESAKQFMRAAATEAGIVSTQLTLALEPEGASVFCKGLPVDRLTLSKPSDVEAFKNGSTYMVMDLGGGTVDITVHKVNGDGTLSEVKKASGGAWGGTQVDAAFLSFLEDIVDKSFFEDFQEKNTSDFIDIMREFEIKKRTVSSNSTGMVTMRFAATFAKKYKREKRISLQEKIDASGYEGKVIIKGDKVKIDAEIFKQFFNKSISNTIQHICEIFQENSFNDVDIVLLVGGFAESTILQDRIKEAFRNKRFIIPNECGLIVLKGAVLFGHSPRVIKSRISKYTYGVELQSPFREGVHSERFKFLNGQKGLYCRNLFKAFVHAGQEVPVDSVVKKRLFATSIDVTEGEGLYASDQVYPTYVVDKGCFKVGNIYLDTIGNEFEVEMTFGGTECKVQVTDLISGVVRSDCFDFLCHQKNIYSSQSGSLL